MASFLNGFSMYEFEREFRIKLYTLATVLYFSYNLDVKTEV